MMYNDILNTYSNDASYCQANTGDMLTFWDDVDVTSCIDRNISNPGFYVRFLHFALFITFKFN